MHLNKYYFLSFEFIKAATTGAPIIAASDPMTVAAFLTVDVVAINEDASLICSKSNDLFSDTAYFSDSSNKFSNISALSALSGSVIFKFSISKSITVRNAI